MNPTVSKDAPELLGCLAEDHIELSAVADDSEEAAVAKIACLREVLDPDDPATRFRGLHVANRGRLGASG
jgi:hypothetical protein